MRQARPVMIPFRCQKHLRFILQSSKRLTMQYPIPVSLKNRPNVTLLFLSFSASRIHAESRIRTQIFLFPPFQLFPNHPTTPVLF